MSLDKPNFVACFDINYTIQALALLESENKIVNYIFFFCMDNESFEIISKLENTKIIPMKFEDYENNHLRQLKKERKKNEYFWTITPRLSLIIFDTFEEVEQLTYIDTDIFFIKSPNNIFENFNKSKKDILLQSTTTLNTMSNESGKFCVQFLIINRKGYDIIKDWSLL